MGYKPQIGIYQQNFSYFTLLKKLSRCCVRDLISDNEIESYVKAGQIACKVLKEVESLVKPGVKLLELAELIESKIHALGGKPAFPVNISINNIAAHYTPLPNDESTIPSNAVVKIDIGVHIDGYIADTATTIALNEGYRLLCEAVKYALEKALGVVGPGVKFSEVGYVVEQIVRSYGFKPIYNLSGHSLDRYLIHAGEVIPNHKDRLALGSFKSGKAYAIEPFATNGRGYVREENIATIYALKQNPKKLSKMDQEVREVFKYIYEDRKTLPFALRWYIRRFSEERLRSAIKTLIENGLAMAYPVLVEIDNGVVAQYEHTIVLTSKGEKIVTTLCH
jgi:methionyl aminopeptidase